MRPIEKEHRHVDWDVAAAEKGGYEHFMLKEIHEQPRAIREATAARIQGGQVVLRDLNMTDQQIRDINKIFIVACGSSYHVGMVGKYNLERMLRRSVEVCLASEFRYSDPIVGKGDLVIVISQSGMMEEFSLGRWAGYGPVGSFGKAMENGGKSKKVGELIGGVPVFASLCLGIGYSVIMGWVFYYAKIGADR